MQLNLYFGVPLVIAFFFALVMAVQAESYKERLFKFLFWFFTFVFLKSLLYSLIGLLDVSFVKQQVGISNIEQTVVNPLYLNFYNWRYLVWHVVETGFIVFVSRFFILEKAEAERKKTKGRRIFFGVQFALLIVTTLVLLVVGLGQPVEGFSLGSEFLDRFLLGFGGRFFLGAWRIALLIWLWLSLGSIYGYTIDLLKPIYRYRPILLAYIVTEMVFHLFSILVAYYSMKGWLVLPWLSVVAMAVFSFGVQREFVADLEAKVQNLDKEKDIIIQLMRDISAIVGSGELDLDVVVKRIVDAAVRGTNARGGALLLKDAVTNRLQAKYVSGVYPPTKPFKIGDGMAVTESMLVEKFKLERIAIGEGLLGQVMEEGESIYIPDALRSSRYVQPVKEYMVVTSFIAVPLKARDNVFGVLTVIDDARSFLVNDLSLVETLAEQAAINIQQIQMYQEVLEKKQAEKEIGVAGEIQSSLVPHSFPDTDKYELYGFSIPAKGVGGDYYDYIDFGNNKIAMTMFDVSGKGVPAALIMVMIRSILRTVASLDAETKHILERLNNTIAQEIVEDRYATGFYLLYDAEKGLMNYTNAGHGPLVLYRASEDTFQFLDTEGMPVGIMPEVNYGQDFVTLESGDIAVLYTDGITEAMNLQHEEFGMERLQNVIRTYRRESAREIANKVLEEVNKFVGTAPQHDDETLLILKAK
ncbi:GAF domain-containing SpoIIE family protein phosphatase [Thermospira aquatica]|uniref:SpoIIE family protein phosphatase n=1 Tax=Thermospira aquatica TaxID=2828656 RepID=A0AAX3BB43_9SPIR|nr:GAF domain-containing SpoIIE family protein phosphatase [Thermospira aquatica]URA09501.1 SpoIIE family protein phosphatase [Thermospira aquatica]